MMKLAHSTRRFQMRDLPIVILLLICTNKWVFEGILDMTIVEAFFLAVGLAIAIVRKKASIPKASLIWLLYCGSIILSVLDARAIRKRMGQGFPDDRHRVLCGIL